MSTFSEKPYDPYAALRIPEFRLFIVARCCITLALQIQAVVVGWQIYSITKDPLSLGLIGLSEALPSISVSLFAGHIADVVNRKKIIGICLSILFACSLGLYALTLNISSGLSIYGALPIYVIIFISGFARGFIGPAIFAIMPQLIPDRKIYGNAVTWNSTNWQAASVLGPAFGGLIYGYFGVSAAYLADGILILGSILFFMLIKSKPLPAYDVQLSVLERLREGIKFVFTNQLILGAMTLDLFAVLFGGAVALLPVFAAEILKTGPEGLGFLRAAPAIGAVLMALAMTRSPLGKNAGKKMMFSVAGFGLCMILFGLSESFWLSLILLFLSGVFDSISVIIRSTLIHTLTPENMKGRVSAVNNIFIGSSNEIGAFESGFAARLMGVVPSVVFGGFITLSVVGIAFVKAKKLRELDLTANK